MNIKKLTELLIYELRVYFKGNKFLMPLLCLLIILSMMYSVGPLSVVSGFSMTGFPVFIIMAWVGFGIPSSENTAIEQIIFLRIKNKLLYYISKIVFLLVLGCMVSLICLIVPLIVHIKSPLGLFDRPLRIFDIVNAFFLLNGCAFAGGSLGSLFPPAVMHNQKQAALLTTLVTVLTIIQTSVIKEFPILKYILWTLPPLDNVMTLRTDTDFFQSAQTVKIFLSLMTYGAIYSMIKTVISYWKKFDYA
ncbi:MAG: hypothetical protein NC318_05620 [Blautia sp.]|nr:hypothetical protein [Lachnoclostridium sp.]MCM1211063.1 hypothetical protein [Blautia sp.]